MTRSLTSVLVALVLSMASRLPGQGLFLEGGVNVGTAPRALEPLCGSARRLRGVGVTARGGMAAGAFRVGAALDYISRVGVRDAADCVPRIGTSVDSSFAPAGNSAATLSLGGSVAINRLLRVGAEGGWVVGHSSWYVGPTLGVQFRRARLEVAPRWHVTAFDDITREYGSSGVRETSRTSRFERSWGAVGRLLLIAF